MNLLHIKPIGVSLLMNYWMRAELRGCFAASFLRTKRLPRVTDCQLLLDFGLFWNVNTHIIANVFLWFYHHTE